ncbi:flagellar hook-length control protein FliK [Undibacterium sp. Jales W-56]|uniref:flagellar hook-length control protein FliK n=1 Tax=Undibacterium sp. Jales W-56 TaxID=2897325 RepID=UPI0021CE0EA2|nr:flagellar hook-length control protein FliK [Undibacterium sp. Jales W-56]MCU6435391.1 flagellar hook-length control protein FliK [Undibacterium sp. Jales W-56]
MQTALILNSTDNSSAPAKQSNAASNGSSGASFNEILNKEITQQKPREASSAPPSPPANAAPATNENKPASNQATAPAVKSDQASNGKIDKSKTQASDNTAKDQTATDADSADKAEQMNNAQLIALVGTIGQLSTNAVKVDDRPKEKETVLVDATAGKTNDPNTAVIDTSNLLAAQLRSNTQDKPDTSAGKNRVDPALTGIDAKLATATKLDTATVAKSAGNNQTELKQGILPEDKTRLTLSDDPLTQGKAKDKTSTEAGLSASEQNSQKTTTLLAAESAKNSLGTKNPALEKLQDAIPATPQAVNNFAQQFAISTNQMAGAAAAEHLAPRVGSSAWDQAVGQKVVWMVAGGEQTAELTLNPPDLGPLQIVLSVSNDQASATFSSAQPEVREALESALPKLRQMMSEAGVQLSGFSVNSQASQQSNPQSNGRSSFSSSRQAGNSSETDTGSTITTIKRSMTKIGGVDTFA